MGKNKVELYMYDLSNGMAKVFGPLLIGKSLEAIWHTSIVVFNTEYFFSSTGIKTCEPGGTALYKPLKIETLGYTEINKEILSEYITNLAESTFAGHTYDLFKHNCNNFTEDLSQFLIGKSIPQYILDLPNEVLNSNLSPNIVNLLQERERGACVLQPSTESSNTKEGSPDYNQLNTQIEEARYNSFLLEQKRQRLREKLLKKQRKLDKKRRKIYKEGEFVDEEPTMADTELVNGNGTDIPTNEQILALEEEERLEAEERKKSRIQPIVYKDLIDVKTDFDDLIGFVDGKISQEEQKCMEELSAYMLDNEGSWALSDGFLNFVGRLLSDDVFSSEVKIKIMNILAVAALKDDVILLLHQDRRDHVLMNFTFEIDRKTIEEQRAVALFIVNMFDCLSPSEWLLYISEWSYNGQQISNIRVTTKVGVHCLLSDDEILQERGAAIIYNLACKEKMYKNIRIRQLLPKGTLSKVFDDVAVELTMALLQYFNSKPSEEQLFRCMTALSKFVELSRQEVPQLIQMIGPDPKTFLGTSERIDELIQQISSKLR